MDDLLIQILLVGIERERIASFANDEIVIDISNGGVDYISSIYEIIQRICQSCNIQLRVTVYRLYQIYGTRGYLKDLFLENRKEFKCLDSFVMPFVLRHLRNELPDDSDYVFEHEGRLAKYMEAPEIEILAKWKD